MTTNERQGVPPGGITYGEERKAAWRIAQSEPGQDAEECASAVADAVIASFRATKSHTAVVRDGKLEVSYCNEFGPTCTVDDVFERMTVADWKRVCVLVLRRLLEGIGADDVARRIRPHSWPTVTLVPEQDTPIINRVRLSMWVPRHARAAFEKAERRAARANAERSPGPLQGDIVPHDPNNIGGC